MKSTMLRLVFTLGVSFLLAQAHAAENGTGKVEQLYKQFLAGAGNQGFVSFQREVVHSDFDHPANSATTAARAKDYVTFYWSGSQFIAAFSRRHPVTNANEFVSADRLTGYDGREYWEMSVNGLKKHGDADGNVKMSWPGETDRLIPVSVSSRVTIISKREIEKTEGKYVHDLTHQSVIRRMEECRRVVQFGAAEQMQGPPVFDGPGSIMINSALHNKQSGQITGPAGRPETIAYKPTDKDTTGIRVSLQYAEDTVTIDRVYSDGKIFDSTRYKIITTSPSGSLPDESAFSWRTYGIKLGNTGINLMGEKRSELF